MAPLYARSSFFYAPAVVADIEGVALLLALAEELYGLALAGGLAGVVDEVYHERLEEVRLYLSLPCSQRMSRVMPSEARGRHRYSRDLAYEIRRVELAALYTPVCRRLLSPRA